MELREGYTMKGGGGGRQTTSSCISGHAMLEAIPPRNNP